VRDNIDAKAKALLIAQTALNKKAQDVVVMGMQDISSITDYFVICSGNSERQVKSLADVLVSELNGRGISPWHIEGREYALWVLLDYNDVIVHIFYKDRREFYNLEALWGDAPIVFSSAKLKND
jgi:ribosome-associated protein